MLALLPSSDLVHTLRQLARVAVLLVAVGAVPFASRAQPKVAPPKESVAARRGAAQLAAPPDDPAARQALADALKLKAAYKDSEALGKFEEVLRLIPAHYQALCEAAVLSVRIGARYSDETRKTAYFDAARAYADRALALRPEGGDSNYAVALALFNQATLRNARGRLQAFRDLRSHVYLATQRRPDLPDAWQLLGRWQYRVAHYNLFERLYSKVAYGGVPDGGNSRAAMESLEKAHALDPQRLQFCYDLARMYTYQGRRKKAIEILLVAEKIPPITSDELVLSRLCRQMLPNLVRQDQRRQKRPARHGERARPSDPNEGR
jgi:tetratricopeptide (TPR) repeat protein